MTSLDLPLLLCLRQQISCS